jgi:hypothetical protein
MKKFTIYITTVAILVLTISNPIGVSAATAPTSAPPSASEFDTWKGATVPNFTNATIGDIISALLPYIFGIAGFLLLLYIVLGGYQVLVSQGDPKQMAAGREKITWAIVGFIVLFSAFWIVQLAGRILNIQQIIDIFG